MYHLRNLGKFSFQNLLKTSRKFELNQSKGKSICLATQSYNCLCQGESYKPHIAKNDDGQTGVSDRQQAPPSYPFVVLSKDAGLAWHRCWIRSCYYVTPTETYIQTNTIS